MRLLNVINSIDTPVCHIETRRWDGLRGDLPADSRPLHDQHGSAFCPGSLAERRSRWAQHALRAPERSALPLDYGVLVKEWRLLQRAVFVIDAEDRLAYVDYVADQMAEPDLRRGGGRRAQTSALCRRGARYPAAQRRGSLAGALDPRRAFASMSRRGDSCGGSTGLAGFTSSRARPSAGQRLRNLGGHAIGGLGRCHRFLGNRSRWNAPDQRQQRIVDRLEIVRRRAHAVLGEFLDQHFRPAIVEREMGERVGDRPVRSSDLAEQIVIAQLAAQPAQALALLVVPRYLLGDAAHSVLRSSSFAIGARSVNGASTLVILL